MQIPIKIKRVVSQDNQSGPRMPNLNQSNSAPALAKKRKVRLFLWFLFILVLIEASIIVFILLTRPVTPYQSLIPAESVLTIYFNPSSLGELTKSLNESQYSWLPFTSLNQSLEGFFNQANLKISELQPLFKDQMVLILLPKSANLSFRWLLIATKKVGDAEFESQLEKGEKNLKQNFNLVSEVYRQTTVTMIKPLNQGNELYFAHFKNLFLLSNEVQTLKSTVDKALK